MSNNIPYVWFVTTMVISSPEAKYDSHVNFKCSKEIVTYNLFIRLNYAISLTNFWYSEYIHYKEIYLSARTAVKRRMQLHVAGFCL